MFTPDPSYDPQFKLKAKRYWELSQMVNGRSDHIITTDKLLKELALLRDQISPSRKLAQVTTKTLSKFIQQGPIKRHKKPKVVPKNLVMLPIKKQA